MVCGMLSSSDSNPTAARSPNAHCLLSDGDHSTSSPPYILPNLIPDPPSSENGIETSWNPLIVARRYAPRGSIYEVNAGPAAGVAPAAAGGPGALLLALSGSCHPAETPIGRVRMLSSPR